MMPDERSPEDVAEYEALKRKALDTLPDIFADTSWAPPPGAILTESVIVMVWMQPDGKNGITTFPATNHWWSTNGMLRDALWTHLHDRGDTSEPDY